MNPYLNLALSALAAGLVSATTIAATTHERWAIGIAFVNGVAIAVVQHIRQLPRKEWTDEERSEKVAPQPSVKGPA